MTSAKLPSQELLSNSLTSELPALPPLTPQQRAFATRYLLDYDVGSAGTYAGLSGTNARMMLRSPEVLAHIKALQEAREKFCIIGKDFAAFQLLDALPKLKGEVEVPLVTKNGTEYVAKKFHASELVRALIELDNISGLSKPQETGPKKAAVNISLNFAGMANQPTVIIEGELNDKEN